MRVSLGRWHALSERHLASLGIGTAPGSKSQAVIRTIIWWVVLVVACVAAAQLGLVLSADGAVSPVWAPTGLAIAALALRGLTLWPPVAIGAFLAAFFLAGNTLPVAAGIALGNTLEAVLGAWALRCLKVRGEVARVRDALAILAVAAFVPLLSATIGVSSLTLGGASTWEQYPWNWMFWWLGDSLGALIVLPVVLAWAGRPSTVKYPARPLEFAGVVVLSVVLTTLASLSGDALPKLAVPFLPPSAFLFPPMVWAVLRLRPREATLVVALAGGLAIMFALAGSAGEAFGPLLFMQIVLAVVGGGALLLTGGIAERAQVEQALWESRERLSLALKAGRSSTFLWDAETGACHASDELLTLYGLTSFGGRYKDWVACVVPEDQAMAREAGQQVIQRGEIEFVFRIRRGDNGEVRWMHGRAKLLRDAAGRPRQMIGIQMDITEHRQAEQQMRQQAILLELTPDPTWVWSQGDGIRFWNRGCEQLYGYSRQEALGKSPHSLLKTIFPASPEEFHLELERDGSWAGELRHTTRDGRQLVVESWMRQLDIDGKSMVLEATRDITDRKQAELAVKESERRLVLALEAGGSSVWEVDVASGAVMYLGEFTATLGYVPHELGTLDGCLAIVHDDERKDMLEDIDKLVRGFLDNTSLECRLRAKDGTWRWVAFQAIAGERDARGKAVRIVGTTTDITRRKLAEAQIQSLNAELEQRVRNRTIELEHANEALLHSNMELQHFAHATAHDLQTPLRSIAGFAQLVQQEVHGRGNERVDEWLSQVVSNTKRLQVLIQELLAYSRLDAQARPFERVDLRQLFDEVVASLAAVIQETGAEISCGPLPIVSADRTQLAQLLQNLIENGIKYNRAKPPRVVVACERREGEWLFSVADNGIGIDPRHHDRIFEIFRRLHTYAQVPGSGIGLTLCRRIVERHGGRIWVESPPGEGSTFYFTLPTPESAKVGMGS
jgi:PAS domain S-box-containing protein